MEDIRVGSLLYAHDHRYDAFGAVVLFVKGDMYFVHFFGFDLRWAEWVPRKHVRVLKTTAENFFASRNDLRRIPMRVDEFQEYNDEDY
jgi:hypothetical protein